MKAGTGRAHFAPAPLPGAGLLQGPHPVPAFLVPARDRATDAAPEKTSRA
jgi:hypothetical protein